MATSYYYNYCGPIVDIFVSHVFKKKPERDFGNLTDDPHFKAFLQNADMSGLTLDQFMREAQRLASAYGRVSIIVDKSQAVPDTDAEAQAYEIRPYLTIVTPENLVDWSFTRIASGAPTLAFVKIKEGDGLYRIWTRTGWELWQADLEGKDDEGAVLIEHGEHALGCVPMVTLLNRREGMSFINGISDINDIAAINKNIFYLCSDAKEIIENTAFPMLALPYEKGSFDEERQIGPKNIMQFDPSEPNSKPFWLEAPHSSLSEIREWVRQDITEIHRIAKMGGVKATEDFAAARSGVALELEYQQMHAVLAEKADNTEKAETEILKLWAKWQDKEFDGAIDYPGYVFH